MILFIVESVNMLRIIEVSVNVIEEKIIIEILVMKMK